MIPQRDLSLLSNRLARKGGRRTPEAVLERDYCLSWLLVGLSATYRDLPTDAVIGVSSINEIAAEKIVALCDPARNEPR
ncbi:MAG: hypothetical protein K0B01_04470, partial [Syntrophobacterales bacterium]|nr:hypothetical protein [Syntrophobacterales bacterium]